MTTTACRTVTRYDPFQDWRDRYPGWRVQVVKLDGGTEDINPATQTVSMDVHGYLEDPAHAYAHVLAHLDLHLDQLGCMMSPAQEGEANDLARIRLDRIGVC